MRYAIVMVTVMAAQPLAAQAAPRVATTLPAAEMAELEAVRKDVWVHWFAGDTAGLRRVLGPELVAISGDSKDYQSLDDALAGSLAFKASGNTLRSVNFAATTAHRFDNVVVMFSHYVLDMTVGGQPAWSHGRATEVFVRHNGKWVHTSWHLDEI